MSREAPQYSGSLPAQAAAGEALAPDREASDHVGTRQRGGGRRPWVTIHGCIVLGKRRADA
jgi:hypothetical protein